MYSCRWSVGLCEEQVLHQLLQCALQAKEIILMCLLNVYVVMGALWQMQAVLLSEVKIKMVKVAIGIVSQTSFAIWSVSLHGAYCLCWWYLFWSNAF